MLFERSASVGGEIECYGFSRVIRGGVAVGDCSGIMMGGSCLASHVGLGRLLAFRRI